MFITYLLPLTPFLYNLFILFYSASMKIQIVLLVYHLSTGLIYEDGSCVTPSDCPCEYHGMFYPSGQTLQEECNNW